MRTALVSALFFVLLFLFSSPAIAFQNNVNVSVGIGGNAFVLYGYTSPYAIVILEGSGIYEQTNSNKSGYFEFRNLLGPLVAQETCVMSIDTLGRISSPNCLPPFPISYSSSIGPVILSPSVSLDKGDYQVGEQAILTGKTIPDSEVTLSFFKDEKRSLFEDVLKGATQRLPTNIQRSIESIFSFKLIRPVEAFTFPELNAHADSEGNYSMALPTNNQSFLRAFVRTEYDSSPSDKSLTLTIKILPWWAFLLELISNLFALLRNFLIPLILIIEALIIFILTRNRKRHRELVIYEGHPLVRLVKRNLELLRK